MIVKFNCYGILDTEKSLENINGACPNTYKEVPTFWGSHYQYAVDYLHHEFATNNCGSQRDI